MGTRKLGDAQQALSKKGFFLKETQHHTYYVLHVDNKPTHIRTYFSHKNAGKDLWENEVKGIKNQLKFASQKELFLFIDCDLSETDYLQLLRERGHILPADNDEM